MNAALCCGRVGVGMMDAATGDAMHRMTTIAITRAKERAGSGWALLSADLQDALVALAAVSVVKANADNAGWERAAEFFHALELVAL